FFEAINIQFKSEDVVKLLKKRFLFPLTVDYIIKNPEDFVLEELPDIVITDLEPSICKNYKGTTIVSVFDKSYEINLYTREVKEI
ncbi:MAG: hypothetical protein NZ893_00980, partial [Candidatus Aenigmarchaeota archaeon]|nr:hypothetical protein [Candidatus Aenigmarchaeota archaeon]